MLLVTTTTTYERISKKPKKYGCFTLSPDSGDPFPEAIVIGG